jgi:hypothetical protein
MNKKIETTNATETKKETPEVIQATPTESTQSAKTENSTISEMPKTEEPTEETSTESLKALQKEVAEKEQQINQQLEVLWASGTQQMLGNHAEPFVSTAEQKPLQQPAPIIQQQPSPLLEPVIHVEQQATQEVNTNEQHGSTIEHGEHELVPIEHKADKKVKKTTKKNSSSAKQKKQ